MAGARASSTESDRIPGALYEDDLRRAAMSDEEAIRKVAAELLALPDEDIRERVHRRRTGARRIGVMGGYLILTTAGSVAFVVSRFTHPGAWVAFLAGGLVMLTYASQIRERSRFHFVSRAVLRQRPDGDPAFFQQVWESPLAEAAHASLLHRIDTYLLRRVRRGAALCLAALLFFAAAVSNGYGPEAAMALGPGLLGALVGVVASTIMLRQRAEHR